MRKIIMLLSMLVMMVLLAACGGTSASNHVSSQKPAAQPQQIAKKADLKSIPDKGNHKTLVVYYSLSGNTKQIAEHIHELVGGDIFEIHTVQQYPGDHDPLIAQAKKELNEGYLPDLQSKIESLDEYDTVFIGSPVWWGTDAPAVRTFLAQNNLSGKTVIPFVTHASAARSGGPGSAMPDIAAQAKNTKTLDGMHFFEDKVSDQDAVADWLKNIGMM